jgi:Tol biopolymer transport system component
MTAMSRPALTLSGAPLVLALAAQVACGGPGPAPGSDRSPAGAGGAALTLEQLLDIRHPGQATWSPAGDRIAFVWDRAGVQNVFVVDPSAAMPAPAALTSFDEGLVDLVGWTGDARAVLFAKDGDLWRASTGASAPERVWTTPDVESGIVLSNDRRRVAFVRGGDLWTRWLDEGREVRLTRTPGFESGPVWAPDDARLAFTSVVAVPQDEATPWNGAKMLFRRLDREPSDLAVVAASGGPPRSIGVTPGTESAPRWLDASRLVFQRVTADLKTREIVVADVATGETRIAHRDEDEKWWSLTYLGPEPVPSPDGRLIAFLSDRDGWDHAYVVPANGGEVVQVTRGAFEVSRVRWSPDGRRLAFDSNEGPLPGARHLVVVDIDESGRPGAATRLTEGRGTHTDPSWSPDGARLLFQRTARARRPICTSSPHAPAHRRCASPSRCPRRSIAARSSSPSSCATRHLTGARCRRTSSCQAPSTAHGVTRRSSGCTVTGSRRTTTAGTCAATTRSITASTSGSRRRATSC